MPRKKKELALYTDAYYAKDGYRTVQYRAKLSMDRKYAKPQGHYKFNEFPNRKTRRNIARTKGIFALGIWGDTVKRLKTIQTFVKPPEEPTYIQKRKMRQKSEGVVDA